MLNPYPSHAVWLLVIGNIDEFEYALLKDK